jgi:uncharacterized protein YdhG (YjbR/CyaY superfamily)
MKKAEKTVTAYLATLDADKRAALKKLRRTIHAVVPRAQDCISYGIPAVRVDGRMLVWYCAAAKHCSFFPGAYPIVALKRELRDYSTSRGTVRFDPEKGLPATLVRKLIKARLAEDRNRKAKRATRPAARPRR